MSSKYLVKNKGKLTTEDIARILELEKANKSKEEKPIIKERVIHVNKAIGKPRMSVNHGYAQTNKIVRKRGKRVFCNTDMLENYYSKQKRFTEPKKRGMLSRIILQMNLGRRKYKDIERDYQYLSSKEVYESKNAKKRKNRKLYKKVQAYEDAKDDITARKGWKAFKIGLCFTLLMGSYSLADYAGNLHNMKSESVYELNNKDREKVYSSAIKVKNKIKEKDGYQFENISTDEFVDGVYKITNYEKDLIETSFKNLRIITANNEDQTFLDKIVKESFNENYETFTDKQKRDYRQLAFELLPYSLPEIFKDSNNYIRNPIVVDTLEAKNSANTKGYRIDMKINNDQKDKVKNLGNILHQIENLEEIDYKSITNFKDGYNRFFEGILSEAITENYYRLGGKEKRDYIQIIYEWLPDKAKEYVQDPIYYMKDTNDYEIGE